MRVTIWAVTGGVGRYVTWGMALAICTSTILAWLTTVSLVGSILLGLASLPLLLVMIQPLRRSIEVPPSDWSPFEARRRAASMRVSARPLDDSERVDAVCALRPPFRRLVAVAVVLGIFGVAFILNRSWVLGAVLLAASCYHAMVACSFVRVSPDRVFVRNGFRRMTFDRNSVFPNLTEVPRLLGSRPRNILELWSDEGDSIRIMASDPVVFWGEIDGKVLDEFIGLWPDSD